MTAVAAFYSINEVNKPPASDHNNSPRTALWKMTIAHYQNLGVVRDFIHCPYNRNNGTLQKQWNLGRPKQHPSSSADRGPGPYGG
jgi:hypothetical protein